MADYPAAAFSSVQGLEAGAILGASLKSLYSIRAGTTSSHSSSDCFEDVYSLDMAIAITDDDLDYDIAEINESTWFVYKSDWIKSLADILEKYALLLIYEDLSIAPRTLASLTYATITGDTDLWWDADETTSTTIENSFTREAIGSIQVPAFRQFLIAGHINGYGSSWRLSIASDEMSYISSDGDQFALLREVFASSDEDVFDLISVAYK